MKACTAKSAPLLSLIYGNPFTIWIVFIAQLGVVLGLSAAIGRLAPGTATGLFMVYAALNGLTLSIIFLAYSVSWSWAGALSTMNFLLPH